MDASYRKEQKGMFFNPSMSLYHANERLLDLHRHRLAVGLSGSPLVEAQSQGEDDQMIVS